MVLLTHLKAGFENKGFNGSTGFFADDGFLTVRALYVANTLLLLPQGRSFCLQ
jgi:hypothetical protein